MSIIINTNISSMLGVTALNKNTNAMNKALERLSTGYRINSSKDDAAGCAISTSLTKDVSSLKVAQSNTQMGQSMIDTANGALNNMSTMLQRIRDLAEQSANGTYGADERKAMQNEVENLINEMYRTKNSTEFNGKTILGAETTRITEAEAEAQGYKVVKTAKQLQENLTTSADCKVMLFADIDLSDLEEVDGSNWTAVQGFKGTLDGNGFTISNLKINRPDEDGQGLFGYTNGATIKNVTLENANVTGNNRVGCLVGQNNSKSTISNCNVFGTVIGETRTGGLVGQNANSSTVENSNSSGFVTGNNNTGGLIGENQSNAKILNSATVASVKGNNSRTGAFVGSVMTSGDILYNEYNSSINGELNAVGYGLTPTEDQIKDNQELIIDPNKQRQKEINPVNLQVGTENDEDSVIAVNTGFEMGLFSINIETEYGARMALKKVDALMSTITDKQTELGAVSSRLDSAMQYQQIQTTTKTSTNSIIKDADFAKESSNYIKQQILQQTTSSLLSTANQNPSIALMLINSRVA